MRAATLAALLPLVVAGCAEPTAGPTPTAPADRSPTGPLPTPASAASPATPTPAPLEPSMCQSQRSATRSPHPTWVLNTTYGDVRIVLYCDQTPITAQNIVTLTERGFFDQTKFHRVVKDFVIQGGDPLSKDDAQRDRWGTGGPGYTIQDEFYCADGTVSHDHPAYCPKGLGLRHGSAGVASMANSGQPGTGGSQFFITARAATELDGKHSVFGATADQASLDVVRAINKAPTYVRAPYHQMPNPPIVIERATIEWD